LTVLAALRNLPPKRRAILVLRYWEDQSVEQTAQIMNCSVHTVKSQTSRGFQTLRRQLSETMPRFAEGALS
ncbi:MAG: sigma-70 family RNA polymerase sigma factor, partial [Stackebrandtia sp.]